VQVLSEGQYIKHDLYGFGVVTESDHGKKKFVTSLMTAELVGEAPPKSARPRRRRKASVAAAKVRA